MIHSAEIREWRDCDVVDPKGRRIGSLEAIYVNTATDEPAMATVRTGLPTHAAPGLRSSRRGDRGTRLRQGRARQGSREEGATIGTDDILPAEQEEAIFKHYEMAYQPGAHGERKLARR